jgi:hypothetical protein
MGKKKKVTGKTKKVIGKKKMEPNGARRNFVQQLKVD